MTSIIPPQPNSPLPDQAFDQGPPLLVERRAEPRARTNSPARLFYGARYTLWIDCLVKDRSPSGAKIQAPAIFEVPQRVVLLDYGQGVAYSAQRRWRKADLAGLWLEVRHDLRNLQNPDLEPVRQAWLALGPAMGAGSVGPA